MSLPAHPQTRRPDVAALFIALALLGLAALIAWDAARLGGGATYAQIGPKTVPYLIAAGLAGLAMWTAIEAWRGDFPPREADRIEPMLWIVGGIVAQMALLTPAGFSIATGVMFGAVARGFGNRALYVTIPGGIIFSLAVYLAFNKGLQLSLPAGPLERLF